MIISVISIIIINIHVHSLVPRHVPCPLRQAEKYGGSPDVISNPGRTIDAHDGKLFINLPAQCTLWFRQIA